MKTPLFVTEMGDILMFESFEEFERYVEPYDLADSRVFDAEGTEFGMRIGQLELAGFLSRCFPKLVPKTRVPIVRVVTDSPLATPPAEFETILREYLSDSKLDATRLQSMSLPDMVVFLENANRFTR